MPDINRVRKAKTLYEQLLLKIEDLETIATHMTAELTGMPRGGNKLADDTWAVLADYRTKCVEAVQQYLLDCRTLDEEIDRLPLKKSTASQTRAVMKCKYLDGMTDEQIAEKLHYSDRYVRQLIFDGRILYYKTYGEEETK
jgi:DNA-directed RNA polymerase specialized sigma24 family protein